MTFFEWLGRLAATGVLTLVFFWIGVFIRLSPIASRSDEGLGAFYFALIWGVVLGFIGFILAVIYVWGVNLLPFLGYAP
jgi:hypothetical protein